MQILEHHRHRVVPGDLREQQPPRSEHLRLISGRHRSQAEQTLEARLDPVAIIGVRHELGKSGAQPRARTMRFVTLGDPTPLADHLAQRPERHSIAVRRRPPLVPVRGVGQAVEVLPHLLRQPGLADASLSNNRNQARATVASRGMVRVFQHPHLVGTPNERRLQSVTPSVAAAASDHAHRPECLHCAVDTLEVVRAGGLELDRAIRQVARGAADKDRSRIRRRLQPRGSIHDLADDQPGAIVEITPGGGLPAQHPGTGTQIGNVQLSAKVLHGGDEFKCGPYGPLGVVLMSDVGTPHRHERVADELVDRPAESLDDLLRPIEIDREHPPHVLGVAHLCQRREPDEVGEHRRDEPALLCRWRGSDRAADRGPVVTEGIATLGAILVGGVARTATRRTGRRLWRAALRAELRSVPNISAALGAVNGGPPVDERTRAHLVRGGAHRRNAPTRPCRVRAGLVLRASRQRLPRAACSPSSASKRAWKLPRPNPRDPCLSITS